MEITERSPRSPGAFFWLWLWQVWHMLQSGYKLINISLFLGALASYGRNISKNESFAVKPFAARPSRVVGRPESSGSMHSKPQRFNIENSPFSPVISRVPVLMPELKTEIYLNCSLRHKFDSIEEEGKKNCEIAFCLAWNEKFRWRNLFFFPLRFKVPIWNCETNSNLSLYTVTNKVPEHICSSRTIFFWSNLEAQRE